MKKINTDILILGAGIGGYETFRSLARFLKRSGITKKITLVDYNNYFTFTPMLHEVASGSIQVNQAAIAIRQLIYKTPHTFLQAKVEKIDPSKKIVQTSQGKISYDYCVVALGSKTNFLSVKGAKENAYSVRDLTAALALHQKIIQTLEATDLKKIDILIVGGGPTGVEVAGQFCHLAEREVKKLYPDKKLKITVVQPGRKLMPQSHKSVQNLVRKKLSKYKVKLVFGKRVVEVKKDQVVLNDGRKLKSDITVWTAGFSNSGIEFLDKKYCLNGLVEVDECLRSKKSPDMYAIGDIAYCKFPGSDLPYPKLAEVAHVQGQYVAKHICKTLKGKKVKPFKYGLRGELVPIGDWYAVAKIGPFSFHGLFAWWLRRTIYLAFIPGFLRKLRIVSDWTLISLIFRDIIRIKR